MLPFRAADEQWNDQIVHYFTQTQKLCEYHRKVNIAANYHFEQKRIRWGLPGVILPIILSPIVIMLSAGNEVCLPGPMPSDYLSTAGLIATGVATGVYNYFDFGARTGKHRAVAQLYDMINSEIEVQLNHAAEFRIAPNVFMTRISMLMSNAGREEPLIPEWIVKAHGGDKIKNMKMISRESTGAFSAHTSKAGSEGKKSDTDDDPTAAPLGDSGIDIEHISIHTAPRLPPKRRVSATLEPPRAD